MSLKPGDFVEHFTIVALLGQGGMGQVYLARDVNLERSVALKIVHPGDAAHPSVEGSDGAARLLREARSAAALDHPNVVTIYEVGEVHTEGEERGRPYIAMELVKGRSLRTFIGNPDITIATRVRWLADMARALAAAHQANLVHRDIKPDNVMVRDDGVIKVLDFGVAKRAVTPSMSSTTSTEAQVLPSLTAKGVAVGTPYYMAPEQMRREPLDGRADQFSWGVVAYELLSGTPAWGREVDALELVSKLLTEHPPSLDEQNPEVPLHVARVVTRAMSKSRGDRFATMDDLLTALEDPTGAFAATVPFVSVLPREVTPPPHAPSDAAPLLASKTLPSRRRLSRKTALLLGCAAIAVAGTATWFGMTKRAAMKAAAVAAAAAAKPECTRATECVAKNRGKPAMCDRSGKCAAIESAECKALYEPEDLLRDDTVWIGAMFPLTGETARAGTMNLNAVELARGDFARASRSLREPDGTAAVHPLAVIACDDAMEGRRAATHLAAALGVPAVIGTGDSASTIDFATSIFGPNDTMLVAPVSLSPLLTNISQSADRPRMVWRTTYDNADTARAIAGLIAYLEANGGAERVPSRVALVRRRSPGNDAFAEAFFKAARFNGASALANEDAYREFSFEAPGGNEDRSGVAAKVAAFAPSIVVFAADNPIVSEIDAAWPHGSKKPVFVSLSAIDDELLRYIGSSTERRRRVFGFTSVSSTLPNARFVLHYNETFTDSVTRAWAPNSAYDAFYLIAYSAYALGRKAVTGPALAESVGRLVPQGTSVDVGASGILAAFDVLRHGGNIDINGTTGSMDFDLRSGEAPVDLVALCAAIDARGTAVSGVESGLVFESKTGQLVGLSRCR